MQAARARKLATLAQPRKARSGRHLLTPKEGENLSADDVLGTSIGFEGMQSTPNFPKCQQMNSGSSIDSAVPASCTSDDEKKRRHFVDNKCRIRVMGCFDSSHIADLELDADSLIMDIKSRLQVPAMVPSRYQTLLRQGNVVPLNDHDNLHAAGFESQEVLFLIKQKIRNPLQELAKFPTDCVSSQVEVEVRFLLRNLPACWSKTPPLEAQVLFEHALLTGNLTLAHVLLEDRPFDPNTDNGSIWCECGCMGPPRMTLLEQCASRGQKDSCLMLLDSGLLTMAPCSTIYDNLLNQTLGGEGCNLLLNETGLYHMILENGWDQHYALCKEYVYSVKLALWDKYCETGHLCEAALDDEDLHLVFEHLSTHGNQGTRPRQAPDNRYLCGEGRRLRRGGQRQCKSVERRQRRLTMAKLSTRDERCQKRILRLQARDHKAWLRSGSLLCSAC
jgi:hypothetical protein